MNMIQYIDLHTHSTASDGTDSPVELVRHAREAGLAAIAVTDHDTLGGLAPACEAAQGDAIRVIRGCELSARTPQGELHILGLWLPEDAPGLEAQLAALRRKRGERNAGMVRKLQELGFDINMEEVSALAKGSVGRPHIARVMVHKGFVGDEREAFQRYLGTGGKAWLPKEVLSPERAVGLLAGLGATVSLAHPFIHGYPVSWLEGAVRDLIPHGLDAIEVWHSEHDPAQTRLALEWAKRYDLGMTGGSDYHGSNKPGISLGKGRGGLRIPLDVLEKLEARRRAQGRPC
ncbi:MAG: PHP domain-containing protein [Desulfovibrio sp.]|nr:PHP domain-containing protein [Desulfovibrio sp.]